VVVSVFLTPVRVFPVKKINTALQSEVSCLHVNKRGVLGRSGTAVLELAVSLPLLITLVFGGMEMANAVFLRQSMNMAAYEAAKVITRPGSNEALARTRCQEIMTVRKVSTYTLTFSPTVTTATARGTQVTVTLSAPASNLSYGPMQFMTGKTLSTTVVMVRL
jgi:Flp pilus assembly protein TadG